jgi:RNA polymerase subunit RPABC4/transcription elongation factor Spt4
MAKRECPSCAMEVDSKNESCPICGYEFPDYSKGFKLLAVLLVILFLLFFIL